MKTFVRAAATALFLSAAALGLSLPTAGAAPAADCATCIHTTADLGPAWSGQTAPAGSCTSCWPSGAVTQTRGNAGHAHA